MITCLLLKKLYERKYCEVKILFIIDDLSSGGAEKLTIDLAIKMNANKKNVVKIMTLSNKRNVYENDLIKNNISYKNIIFNQIKNPLNIFYITYYIFKHKFDVVHVNLFPANYWVSISSIILKKLLPTKFIFTEHSTWNSRRKLNFLRFIERIIYSNFHRVVSISEEVEKNLLNWLKVKDTEKFLVIHNGVDLRKNKPSLVVENNNVKDTKTICMIGRFTDAKDHDTLLYSTSQLSNIRLLLVGEGPKEDYYKQKVKELKIEDKVIFLGYQKNIAEIMNSVDIVVQSSNWEGFGLAAVEAMAFGKPVIASDVPGLNDIVKNYGILFSKGNFTELTHEINNLLNNKDHYKKIQQKCIERSKNYDLNTTVKKYNQLYEEIE